MSHLPLLIAKKMEFDMWDTEINKVGEVKLAGKAVCQLQNVNVPQSLKGKVEKSARLIKTAGEKQGKAEHGQNRQNEENGNFVLRKPHYVLEYHSNTSFITLVPKKTDPLNLNLIGCITKTISKILARRLKPHMDNIISKEQTTFI
ncbi:hypothetical protein LXL04_035615 [Taraxacum kok-saghyz]